MTESGSVTHWLRQLKAGDVSALTCLHGRYWPFLTRLADRELKYSRRREADREDVAQEALLGFYQSVKRGAFPKLECRHDLMAVLALITIRKAATQLQRERRLKRGGHRVQGESVLDAVLDSVRGLEQLPDNTPTPQEKALLLESYQQYMQALPPEVRPFASLFLAGYTYPEIATALGCSRRTVERKIPAILSFWRKLAAQSLDASL